VHKAALLGALDIKYIIPAGLLQYRRRSTRSHAPHGMQLERRALLLMERRAHRWKRRSALAAALLVACCAVVTRAAGEPSRSLQQASGAAGTVCWRKANNYPAQTCQPSACNNASEWRRRVAASAAPGALHGQHRRCWSCRRVTCASADTPPDAPAEGGEYPTFAYCCRLGFNNTNAALRGDGNGGSSAGVHAPPPPPPPAATWAQHTGELLECWQGAAREEGKGQGLLLPACLPAWLNAGAPAAAGNYECFLAPGVYDPPCWRPHQDFPRLRTCVVDRDRNTCRGGQHGSRWAGAELQGHVLWWRQHCGSGSGAAASRAAGSGLFAWLHLMLHRCWGRACG
jgi:hypothetical protein